MALLHGPRPSDRFIPWYFVAFFVVLTIILGVFTAVAVRHYSGVVVEHAYEDGVAYNKILQVTTAQRALGWKEELEVTPLQKTTVRAVFTLHDAAGRRIDKAQAKIVFRRPTSNGLDRTAELTQEADGRYQAVLELPVHGVWDAYVAALADGHHYQTMRRVVIP